MTKRKKVVQVPYVSEKKKFITIAELKRMGYTYYKIGKLEEDGQIKRLNRSTYENLFTPVRRMTFSVPSRMFLRESSIS